MVQNDAEEIVWLHQAMDLLVARHGKRGAARQLGVTRPTLEEWSRRTTPTPRMREAVGQAVREIKELPEAVQSERLEDIAEQMETLTRQMADVSSRLEALESQQTALALAPAPDERPGLKRSKLDWLRGVFRRGAPDLEPGPGITRGTGGLDG